MMPVSCCGKKPFGMTTNSYPVAATVASMTPSVIRRCLRATIEGAIIDRDEPGEERFERAGNPALLPMRRGRQQFRAEHRSERQRDQHRDQNRDGDGDGEFPKHQPDHAAHQEQRNEHRDQRNRNRQDGESDLAGAIERGL